MQDKKEKIIHMRESHETKIALLEQLAGNIDQTLLRFENKVTNLESNLGIKIDKIDLKMESRIDYLSKKMDTGFNSVESRIWNLFFWGIGAFAGVLALIAHALKWI